METSHPKVVDAGVHCTSRYQVWCPVVLLYLSPEAWELNNWVVDQKVVEVEYSHDLRAQSSFIYGAGEQAGQVCVWPAVVFAAAVGWCCVASILCVESCPLSKFIILLHALTLINSLASFLKLYLHILNFCCCLCNRIFLLQSLYIVLRLVNMNFLISHYGGNS